MSHSLRPATPPGSPAIPSDRPTGVLSLLPAWLSRRIGQALEAALEPQDGPGLVAVGFFTLSSISSAVVWAVAIGAIPMSYYHLVSVVTRSFGQASFIVAIGFGFLSDRPLPRWLAGYLAALAAVWYGWDHFGLSGSIYPWNVASHAVLGVFLTIPALLAHAWRRLTSRTA